MTCTSGKYKYIQGPQTVASCETACAADPSCVEFKLKLDKPKWCTLSNSSQLTPPRNSTGYGCGCKGQCPPPGPKPSPHPHPKPPQPSPVPPMNRTLDFENAYYFGWAMYWMMLLDVQTPGTFETVGGHAQSAPNNFLGIHLHDSQYYQKVTFATTCTTAATGEGDLLSATHSIAFNAALMSLQPVGQVLLSLCFSKVTLPFAGGRLGHGLCPRPTRSTRTATC